MSLYQIKTSKTADFDCVKFDDDLNYENTYQLTFKGRRTLCNCPAGMRKSCRHREMLPVFELERAIDSGRFYDFTNKKWLDSLIP